MEIIQAGQGKGKTTTAIKMASTNRYVIVCANGFHVNEVIRMSMEMGLHIPEPVTFGQFFRKDIMRGHRPNGVIIDDLDFCLQEISRVPIIAATVGVEYTHPRPKAERL